MNLEVVRQEFPHTRHTIYLNHAATAPLSRRVVAAINEYVEERHNRSIDYFARFAPRIEETRVLLGRLINAEASAIEFTTSTSSALSVLAEGMQFTQGDRIAIPACEFPANVYPFLNLQRKGVVVDFIPHRDGVFDLDDIARVLTPRTRLVSLSWVQFLSGYRIDLREVARLCQRAGAIFCVDAIQGLGALELDVEESEIDFLACGCQKWMMGELGTAFFYVRESLLPTLQPFAGWLHGPVDWDNFYDYKLEFHEDARRFRQGTQNVLGIAALNAALKLYLEADPAWCEEQVLARAGELARGLTDLGFERYGSTSPEVLSGIVTVKANDLKGLYRELDHEKIVSSVRNGMLRFSPTWYNSPTEIQRTLEVIAEYTC